MKKLLSVGVVMFVMAAFSSALASDYCEKDGYGGNFCITTDAAYQMIMADQDKDETNVIILDVRTPEEWKYIGYPGENAIGEGKELNGRVIKIDYFGKKFLSDVSEAFEDMPDATIITMCRSGKRSYLAAQAMIDAGYNVYSMSDGFEGDKDDRKYRVVNGWKVLGYTYRY